MAQTQKEPAKRRFKLSSIILLLVVVGAFWQRQAIYDQYMLRTFTPTAEISQFATDTAMTDNARRIYYVNHPELKPKATFTDFCPDSTEETAVLGCYISGQRGIYLLSVTNAELQGIQQVTAAHEMLHAAHERLSSRERSRIDAALTDYYRKNPNNEVVKQTLKSYKDSSQSELINEMHSIFGTQISDLPPALTEYYDKYFADRSKVVAYYAKYEQAFTTRQNQIESYDAQLNSLKKTIDNLEDTATTQRSEVDSKRRQLDNYEQTNQIAAYNNNVASYNATVRAYNDSVNRIQALVDQYNKIIADRNDIAFQERQLVESITTPARAE